MCRPLPYRSESQHRGRRGDLRFPGSGNREGADGAYLGFARLELAPVDPNLTSRPERVAANEIYRRSGFERRGTNVYRMRVNV